MSCQLMHLQKEMSRMACKGSLQLEDHHLELDQIKIRMNLNME